MHSAEKISGNLRRDRETEQQHRPKLHSLRNELLILLQRFLVTHIDEQRARELSNSVRGYRSRYPTPPEEEKSDGFPPDQICRRHEDHARSEHEHRGDGGEQKKDRSTRDRMSIHDVFRPAGRLVYEVSEGRGVKKKCYDQCPRPESEPKPDCAPPFIGL